MSDENAGKVPPGGVVQGAQPQPTSPSRPPPLPPQTAASAAPARESIDDLLDDFIIHANRTFSAVTSTDWDLRTTDVELLDEADLIEEPELPRAGAAPEAGARFEAQLVPEGKPALAPPVRAPAPATEAAAPPRQEPVAEPLSVSQLREGSAPPTLPAAPAAEASTVVEPSRAEPVAAAPAAAALEPEKQAEDAIAREVPAQDAPPQIPAAAAPQDRPAAHPPVREQGGRHRRRKDRRKEQGNGVPASRIGLPGGREQASAAPRKDEGARAQPQADQTLATQAGPSAREQAGQASGAADEPLDQGECTELVARPLPLPKAVQRGGISRLTLLGGIVFAVGATVGVMTYLQQLREREGARSVPPAEAALEAEPGAASLGANQPRGGVPLAAPLQPRAAPVQPAAIPIGEPPPTGYQVERVEPQAEKALEVTPLPGAAPVVTPLPAAPPAEAVAPETKAAKEEARGQMLPDVVKPEPALGPEVPKVPGEKVDKKTRPAAAQAAKGAPAGRAQAPRPVAEKERPAAPPDRPEGVEAAVKKPEKARPAKPERPPEKKKEEAWVDPFAQ